MERATPLIEALGGKVENAYYAFGDYDVILIAEMPGDVSMAAGAVKTMKTTALMIPEDGVEAMPKAGGLEYRPPGG